MQDEVLAIIRKIRVGKTSITNIPPPSMGTSYMPYPVEVKIGGATVFVVPVDHFEKI